MKLFYTCLVGLMLAVSSLAWAVDGAAQETVLPIIDVLKLFFSDSTIAVIVAVLSTLFYAWTQLRRFIPAQTLAKLPRWVIWLLEQLAANAGKAANERFNDPAQIKREQ